MCISPVQLRFNLLRSVNPLPVIRCGLIGREEGGLGSRANVAVPEFQGFCEVLAKATEGGTRAASGQVACISLQAAR